MKALAIVAHPDDVEFMLAGTLLALKEAGVDIHILNLANGSLGSASLTPDEAARIRWDEARLSASIAGAGIQPPLFNDLEIFYNRTSLGRVLAALRRIEPDIVLTQYLSDYMEDHQNSARLTVSAAFARGIAHAYCEPFVAPYDKPVALYHAMPHGLCDPLGRRVIPERYINIAGVIDTKSRMLECHRSQYEWLQQTQGLMGFVASMVEMAAMMGALSGRFEYAEGLVQHSHLGFGPENFDPISDLLGENCLINESFSETINSANVC